MGHKRYFLALSIATLLFATMLSTKLLGQNREQKPISIQRHSSTLVYIETKGPTSVVWAIDVDESGVRNKRSLLTVNHVDGYPINASLDPTGTLVAYTLLPSGNQPAFSGTVWLAPLDGSSPPKLVDTNVDYGWTPKWSRRGDAVIYEKKVLSNSEIEPTQYYTELLLSDRTGAVSRLFSDLNALEVVPVGWSPKDDFIYVDRVTSDGDSLYSIDTHTGTPHLIAHLSDTASVDLVLSADGDAVLANIPATSDVRRYALAVISTKDGRIEKLQDEGPLPHRAIWDYDSASALLLNQDEPVQYSGLDIARAEHSLSAVRQRHLSPLQISSGGNANDMSPEAWSPDKNQLALKLYYPSIEALGVWTSSSSRVIRIPSSNLITFVGWLK